MPWPRWMPSGWVVPDPKHTYMYMLGFRLYWQAVHIYSMGVLDKRVIHVPGRTKILPRYSAHNLKLMNCFFLEFSTYYFQTTVDLWAAKTLESKTTDKERITVSGSALKAWEQPQTVPSVESRGCVPVKLHYTRLHWAGFGPQAVVCWPRVTGELSFYTFFLNQDPRRLSGKESACQCRRLGFSPWLRKIPWKSEWGPIPVFLPGESHGQRNLAGYSPWGHEELDTTR